MTPGKEYLRAADIAALTGMSPRTVRRWIANQVLPSTKLGGARLVACADLKRLLASLEFPENIEEYERQSKSMTADREDIHEEHVPSIV
jgi:excisionase family DNA binding protein